MTAVKGAPKPGTRIYVIGNDGSIYYGEAYTVVGEARQVAQSRVAPPLQGPPWWDVVVECDKPCGAEGHRGPAGECRHLFLLSPSCWEEA